jgi:uncharacterized protein
MHRQRLRQFVRPYRSQRPLPVVREAPGSDRNDRIPGPYVLILWCLFLLMAIPVPCAGEAKRLFRIGTGGTLGVYYPIGKAIAQGLTGPGGSGHVSKAEVLGLPGYVGVAQSSGGSVANVRALASGEIEAGIVQADVASWAFQGERVFAGDESVKAVRAVASLYPEKFQIVTRRDANIRSVTDLRGKRISIDEIGSGTLMVMRIVLDAYGLSEIDMYPLYLKPNFIDDKMMRGELQGFVVMAGIPMEAAERVADLGLFLVPVEREIALRIKSRFPYLIPGDIPAGAYPGVPETPTLQVHALLVVSSTMPEDLVYQATACLWSERTMSLLKGGHPQAKAITLKTALEGISIPLHPGAERFYREHGMLSKGTPSP